MEGGPGRGRAVGRRKEGQLPFPQLHFEHVRAEGESREGGRKGQRAGSQGCGAGTATCPFVNSHQPHNTEMPLELQSHRFTNTPRQAQRHKKVQPCNRIYIHT